MADERHRAASFKDRAVRRQPVSFRPKSIIGVEWITGTISIQTTDHAIPDDDHDRGAESIGCRVRVRLPRWLSDRALESYLYKDSWSWKHVLTPYTVREMTSTLAGQLTSIAKRDDVQGLRRFLQSGQISLGDQLLQRFPCFILPTGRVITKIMYEECNLFSVCILTIPWYVLNTIRY